MKGNSLHVVKRGEFIIYQSMVSNVNAPIKPKYLDFAKFYQN